MENKLSETLSPQLSAAVGRIEFLTRSKFLRQEKSYLVFLGKAGETILLPMQFAEPPAFIPQQEDEQDDEEIFY